MTKPFLCKAVLPIQYKGAYPFEDGEHLLNMGEIENMQGHVIVVNRAGRVIWGYHAENFVRLTEEEM